MRPDDTDVKRGAMDHNHRRGFTTGVAAAAAVIMAASAAGCSGPPDADPVAQRLAAALQSGELDDVPWTGATGDEVTTAVEELTSGMGEAPLTVEVSDVREAGDDQRAAELELAWDLGGEAWEYTSTAALVLVDDAWQVEWDPAIIHPDLVPDARLAASRQPAERGDILGADGAAIVTERPVYRVGIDKTRIPAAEVESAARKLAAVVDVDADGLADRAEAAGPEAFVEAITLREADAVPVLSAVDEIDGAVALEDTLALAPTREFARPILGTVGEATAEIIEESDGAVEPGDIVGLSGLQQQYEEQLRGTPGITVEIVPPEGEPTTVYETEPQPGADVSTTLDPDLQTRAEQVLADVGPPSAITVVQPSTGAVLAAASGPGSDGYSTATLGQYAPGSTFKIVTSLALLRAGLTADTSVNCTPTVTVDGRSFENYDDYPSSSLGEIPLRTAVAESCNTALIDQHDTVSQAQLAQAAEALGIGTQADIGAPAFLGDVPAEAGATAHAASMIGQGEVLASPLAMATMAASVAAGSTVVPKLVDGAEPAAATPQAPLTSAEADVLRELMYAVVSEGSATFLGDVPGERVGAKTGTAEYGSEDPPRTHAWMVAIQGDLAVAVFVEDGESGSRTAGPLLSEFLSQ